MTTNLEWLYENDRETLLVMTAGDCDDCKFDINCRSGDYRCDRRWLNAEYVEHDSWEKIEKDSAQRLDNYCIFTLGWEESKLNWYSSDDKAEFVMGDIIRRCKKLAGVE